MILYRITKERKTWTNHYFRDKHEVVITDRKARANMCLMAAERENAYYEQVQRGHQYRCLVEIKAEGTDEFEFMKEVEFPVDPNLAETLAIAADLGAVILGTSTLTTNKFMTMNSYLEEAKKIWLSN